jgi:ERCC4-related helicase
MSTLYPFCSEINLHVKGRISSDDAARQAKTAREILKRLHKQPGLILADEVGMGKTFVALAVAVSVALENRGKRPVVVMVPSSLKEKWPADFALFCEKCLPDHLAQRVRFGRAERAVEFLKLLDDPPSRRKSVIFLTHGAMSRGLNDHWVMLALIRQSLFRRKGIDRLRNALCRSMGDLLQMKWVQNRDPDIWLKLLKTAPSDWLPIMEELGLADDDPVPAAVVKVLPKLDTSSVLEAVQQIPLRRSKNYHDHVRNARHVIKNEVRSLWKECLEKTRLRLPLLILDEAHHLKNADTKLASLFHAEDAQGDADEISRGPLAGVFERMLFLTATPFQLGHGELCSVLDRFDGICWKGAVAPEMGRDGFERKKERLRSSLDAAQEAAVTLDHAWGRLHSDDFKVDDTIFERVDDWWGQVHKGGELTPAASDVLHCFERTKERMATAEKQLHIWVIRHLKPRNLPGQQSPVPRRKRLVGRSIQTDNQSDGELGIAVENDALLPFLLAARATSHNPESRPVFAEGLASSYEAFLHTRSTNGAGSTDEDDDETHEADINDDVHWYLNHLESLIPRGVSAEIHHPKVAATVQRVVDIWSRGEKAVVFCHYVATGRVLRQKVSEAIQAEIRRLGAEKLKLPDEQVATQLDLIGKRFFDEDSPLRRACDAEAIELISQYPSLSDRTDDLVEIIRRNVRTPSFLVRYFPLDREKLDDDAMKAALDTRDLSGLTLRQIIKQFLSFLVERCGTADRERYINAVKRIQTGAHFGFDATREYDDNELQGATPEQLLPNVRLVNGTTRSDTRQRLMLTFNTPFYPEVLIASSVMAEGVDLHLNCRYVLHHDLCWNPSTLEQRTGRVDRIGAKAEVAGQPIHIYLPFIAETQDEKMYRVVMDRERWFNVVMGEDYKVDVRTTEKLASRIPFPANAANDLAFKLDVD